MSNNFGKKYSNALQFGNKVLDGIQFGAKAYNTIKPFLR